MQYRLHIQILLNLADITSNNSSKQKKRGRHSIWGGGGEATSCYY